MLDFLPLCSLLWFREVLDSEQKVHESWETAAGVGVVGVLRKQQVPEGSENGVRSL